MSTNSKREEKEKKRQTNGTVRKYYVSVDCQESYIVPRDYIFPKCPEGKYSVSQKKGNPWIK